MNIPKKVRQIEHWQLTEDNFPMAVLVADFMEDTTEITISDNNGMKLFNHTYDAFQFTDAPEWLLKVLNMCNIWQ
jgi:hypothetical protein